MLKSQEIEELLGVSPAIFLSRIQKLFEKHPLELDQQEEISPMDTVGNLIDKLITVDLKLWHNQEELYRIRKMNHEEFSKEYSDKMTELHSMLKRCCDLNLQRAKLMDEIDKFLLSSIREMKEDIVREQHKIY